MRPPLEIRDRFMEPGDERDFFERCSNGHHFAKCWGKPHPQNGETLATPPFTIARNARPTRVYELFIAMLKLPFKFDRS
jgi:hypothetical protein